MRLALEFRADALSLLQNNGGEWALIEEISIGSPPSPAALDGAMPRMIKRCREIGGGTIPPLEIWLPTERILVLEFGAPDDGEDPTSLIAAALTNASPAPVSELIVAHAPWRGGIAVAAVESVVVEEVLSYALEWGFEPARMTTNPRARTALAAFPGGPDFTPQEQIAHLSGEAAAEAPPPEPRLKDRVIAGALAQSARLTGRRLTWALLGAGALAVAALAFLVFPGDQPEPVITPSVLAAPAPLSAPLREPAFTVGAAGATTVIGAAPGLPTPRRVVVPAQMENGGAGPTADAQARQPTHAGEPALAAAPTSAPGGSVRVRDASETPEPPDAADAPAEIETPQETPVETPVEAPAAAAETPRDAMAALATALAQVATPPTPRPATIGARQETAAAPDTVAAPVTAPVIAQITAEEIDQSGPPGPGAVGRAPAPGPRPDALDMTPSARIATLSPTPKRRPKSIRPRVPSAAIAAGEPNVREVAAPRRPPPQGAGVASAATLRDAIPLSDMNLLGVFGSSKSRRALLRLSSGQVLRVSQGTVVEGWVISRIDATSMRITRGGDARTLELVR
ncbi:MAG: hypothetical protein WD969_13940 [Paracoccaceae bacterium]